MEIVNNNCSKLSKQFNIDNRHLFQTHEFVIIRPFTEVPSTSVPNMSVMCGKIRRAFNLHRNCIIYGGT